MNQSTRLEVAIQPAGAGRQPLAPELARSRDYYTGIELGRVVSESTLLSRRPTSYHRTTPREAAAAFGARALGRDDRAIECASFGWYVPGRPGRGG